MRTRHLKRGALLILVSALWSSACREPSSQQRTPPAFVAAILDYSDRLEIVGSKAMDADKDEFVQEINRAVTANPMNVRARVMLAQAYKTHMNYRKALTHMEIAAASDESLADPHYGLGDIYYELALLDMVARQKFEQHEKGFLLFNPDSTTRQIFARAMEEYSKALSSTRTLTIYSNNGEVVFLDRPRADMRLKQASLYIAGSRERAVFTEDQSKAAIWLMQSATEDVSEATRRTNARNVIDYYVNQLENRQGALMPNALPVPGAGGPGRWLAAIPATSHAVILTRRRSDQSLLDAAVDLGWNLAGWMLVASVEARSERDRRPDDSLAALTQSVQKNLARLDIRLDERATQILRDARYKERHMMDQIDTTIRTKFGARNAVPEVYFLTATRTFVLQTLAIADPLDWAKFVGEPGPWQTLQREASNAGLHSIAESLKRIGTELGLAGGRRDAKGIDAALSEFDAECNAILAHKLATGNSKE